MCIANVYELKTNISKYLELLESGKEKEIIICRYGKKIAIISSDYHIATGVLLFSAEAVLRAGVPGNEKLEVVSNAAWKAPSGSLSAMFQAGALIELSGDTKTAYEIYYDNYDIHELPPLN